jgi:hypothetical protein
MNRGGLILVLLTATVLLQRCTPGPVCGGGGASETVASVFPCVQGLQVSVTGKDDFSVEVGVYNRKFTVVDSGYFNSTAVLTGDDSVWRLPLLSDSVFSVFVIEPGSGKGAYFLYDNRTAASREPLTKRLAPPGDIAGTVTVTSLINGDTLSPADFRVVVPGSRFSASIADDGAYSISGIPEGTYFIRAVSIVNEYDVYKNVADTVAVSGDSISVFDLSVQH